MQMAFSNLHARLATRRLRTSRDGARLAEIGKGLIYSGDREAEVELGMSENFR
jgi:hypothetical protein